MTLPSLDLYCADNATITAAVQDVRCVTLTERTKRLSAALRECEEFHFLTAAYTVILNREIAKQTTEPAAIPLEEATVATIMTMGIRIGHAIAMRQLEAASGTG